VIDHARILKAVATKGTFQKVIVLRRRCGMQRLFDAFLDVAKCEVVFVESIAHAYLEVKSTPLSLLVACLEFDDLDGFQLLSMLKLDRDTRKARVVICTIVDDEVSERHSSVLDADDAFARMPTTLAMN
jgi:PleD family two-component response regulator